MIISFNDVEIQIQLNHLDIFRNKYLIIRMQPNVIIPGDGTFKIFRNQIYQTGEYSLPKKDGWKNIYDCPDKKKFSISCSTISDEDNKHLITDMIIYFPKTSNCFYEGALCIYNEFRNFDNLFSEVEKTVLHQNSLNMLEKIQHV